MVTYHMEEYRVKLFGGMVPSRKLNGLYLRNLVLDLL